MSESIVRMTKCVGVCGQSSDSRTGNILWTSAADQFIDEKQSNGKREKLNLHAACHRTPRTDAREKAS